ncbi:MAG: hypothetical protein LBU67_04230 [Oscillospiraceae bacterium]|jgi:membrane-bound ClpP family serine protease|nr:hypothetical protein [Oscillospiraceae bacterium]
MLAFIADNLVILVCVLAGMALVTLEVFLPGFGLPGISGIVLLLLAMGLTAARYGGVAALGLFFAVAAILAIVVSASLKSAARGGLSRSRFVLSDVNAPDEDALSAEDMQALLGRQGKALTVLRPVGIADFDGVRLNVVTEGDYLSQDEAVVIVRTEGSRIVVRKV